MSGRVLRFLGDRAVEPSAADLARVERARSLRQAVVASTARPPMPATEAAQPATAPQPPDEPRVIVPGGGVLSIQKGDVRKRLPALEAFVKERHGLDVVVWGVTHYGEANGVALKAMVQRGKNGMAHVFINLARAQCPILRLSLLEHEVHHVARGDLETPFGADAFAEAACDAAGEAMISGAIRLFDLKGAADLDAPSPSDHGCISCYREGGACRQSETVYQRVQQLLRY